MANDLTDLFYNEVTVEAYIHVCQLRIKNFNHILSNASSITIYGGGHRQDLLCKGDWPWLRKAYHQVLLRWRCATFVDACLDCLFKSPTPTKIT